MRRLLVAFLMTLCLVTAPAIAQTPPNPAAEPPDTALLVADIVYVEADSVLIAEGNVEAIYQGRSLTADRIVFDQEAGTLSLDGPIRIVEANGDVLTATSATLDDGFRNGILAGARIVLDEQLQLAAVEARRLGGRYTQLSKVAVTSCQVCGRNRTPLWQIRAGRVIHDEEERQIYFDNATFHVLDVPVLYFPRLRIPDPTLARARGFLPPEFRTSSLLGFGIKVPYFIPLGPHQDITVTPYLSTESSTLELRYRRAFRYGNITVNTATSRDSLFDGVRAYAFVDGSFDLPRDFKLDFGLQSVSDEAYLDLYGYSSADRLRNYATVSRYRRDSALSASIDYYETLRDEDTTETKPSAIVDVDVEQRFFPKAIGGELRLTTESHAHYRPSDRDTDGSDADSIVDGRDVSRLSATLSWRDRYTLPAGMRAGVLTQVSADHIRIAQDVLSEPEATIVTPAAALELRWPFLRRGRGGSATLIEPLAQVAWSGGERPTTAADESTRQEFDEGNLLSLSRFPATDRRERGRVTALGLRWHHRDPIGWQAGLTLGQVWRADDDTAFTRSSGLGFSTSDILVASHFETRNGFLFTGRGLIDLDDRAWTKAEARAAWETDRMDLGASYLLLRADPDEDRDDTQSEWTVDGSYIFSPEWSADGFWRYDLGDNRSDRAGLGVTWQNECVSAEISVSRRFASSTNLEPSTDIGLTVLLKGFSTGGSAKEYRRTCSSF
ncbi:LPS-assembly protein LptD precursor [Roseivivax sp. THAF40]|uniref:LPS-assembly protein LptD n=1 Tax=unclassified Roseivivax TaxID=2639302 RepID=UPI0012A97BB1|nr:MULTISPECIES: LPS assembly protein LptD [unclassified Roseivivax]QFS82766.1 LPS-assembly protein LptD precursor [Roseivivax sp. THAF197b]QFT46535.1 LPS-assembly protein LptD precursor [Roseivivax sp. THAF40]